MLDILNQKNKIHKLQVSLPKGWNELTTEQVEKVSKIFIESARKYNKTQFFSEAELLSNIFIALLGLRVISRVQHNDDGDVEDDWFECEFENVKERAEKQTIDGVVIPIRLYVWEIASYSIGEPDFDKNGEFKGMKGGLQWVLKPCNLTIFPYPNITLEDKKKSPKQITLQGPAEFMQDFKWRQYRMASDYMQLLPKIENSLLQMKQKPLIYGSTRISQVEEELKQVRAEFLATLFSASIPHINDETGQPETSYYFVSSQCIDNSYLFLDFPEEKFQAISFWWQGIILHLSKQFPKVFKREKFARTSPDDDAFKLYTRSTTTMIKYAGSNEEEVNNTTYTIILQHLNDMAEENERVEEMKRKHK